MEKKSRLRSYEFAMMSNDSEGIRPTIFRGAHPFILLSYLIGTHRFKDEHIVHFRTNRYRIIGNDYRNAVFDLVQIDVIQILKIRKQISVVRHPIYDGKAAITEFAPIDYISIDWHRGCYTVLVRGAYRYFTDTRKYSIPFASRLELSDVPGR